MIDRFQYFGGYLRIKVWGFSPERFMNLCSNKEILLWDIVREGDHYYMNIGLQSFYKLRPIARKTGVRVAILQRYGLPFFTPVVKKRRVFLSGLIFALMFWIISANFIWNIEINGNYSITDDVLTDFLKEENVRIGMLKKKLDIAQLEKDLRKEFTDITWTSVKLNGIRLQIDIKENDALMVGDNEENDVAGNIISEYDGTIVSIIVRSGTPKVKAGDVVEKGAVLVDGAIPIYNDDATIRQYNYVAADADIVMEHNSQFSAKLPFTHVEKEYTGREKTKYFVRAGDNEIKIPAERPYLVYDSLIRLSRPTVFEKLEIPVYLGKYNYREYMNVEYEYSLSEATDILNKKLNTFITTLNEKGVQIIEKNVKIDTSGGFWILEGDFLVRESAGKSVEIDINEMNNSLGETLSDE